MKLKLFLSAIVFFMVLTAQAQEFNERYIEVTGTSEIEIVPDKIHYIIEIREYFKEEFDGKSKPEEYHTKVPLSQIEQELRKNLAEAGITQDAIRTQEIGDYWRKQGQDFLVSKQFDITLTDFKQIDEIIKYIDTKGINTMRIGELENKDILAYHQRGKIEALKAAQRKAAYLVETLGKKLGSVIRIVEGNNTSGISFAQSNVMSSNASSFDSFRTIKKNYSILVRFEIVD
ncbi:SIMPL domain-containing protein [Parabacteroides sp.]